MDSKENLLGVLETVFKWKKQILRVLLVTAVGSVIISLLLSNYYQSSTLFYAASQDLAKPASVGPTPFTPNYYGEGEDIDRIMTIANSGELLDYLVYRFDLYRHYDIDTAKTKAPFQVRETLLSHYNVVKTKYDAIELSVEDKEPELAASMANAAREKIEEIGRRLVKSSLQRQINKYQTMISAKEKEISVVGDSLKVLRDSFGIYFAGMGEGLSTLSTELETRLSGLIASRENFANSKTFRARAKQDTLAVLDARIQGMQEQKNKLDERLDKFTSGIGKVDMLERLHAEARLQLGLDKEMFKQIQNAYDSDFSILILVEEATVPVVKSRPKRSLLVLGAMIAALIFCVIGVLLIEQYKDVNWRKIFNG